MLNEDFWSTTAFQSCKIEIIVFCCAFLDRVEDIFSASLLGGEGGGLFCLFHPLNFEGWGIKTCCHIMMMMIDFWGVFGYVCYYLRNLKGWAQTCKKEFPQVLRNPIFFSLRFSAKFALFSAKLWALHVENTNNLENMMQIRWKSLIYHGNIMEITCNTCWIGGKKAFSWNWRCMQPVAIFSKDGNFLWSC